MQQCDVGGVSLGDAAASLWPHRSRCQRSSARRPDCCCLCRTRAESHRYRLAKVDGGYLITARTKDPLGLIAISEWLHETEEAARACLDAIKASNDAWEAMQSRSPDIEARFSEMETKLAAHRAACARQNDHPLIGDEVRRLRDAYRIGFD